MPTAHLPILTGRRRLCRDHHHAGTATITGALADGIALSQSAPVSADGYVPIYASLTSVKGLLLGWINLNLTNTTGVGLTWIRPGTKSGIFYTNGFTNVYPANQLQLSYWTNATANFENLTNLSVLDTVNGASETNIDVTVSSAGKITVTGTKTALGSVTPKTGVFTVTIGSGASKVAGHGAISLLNGTNGGGYFTTKTNAGAIILAP